MAAPSERKFAARRAEESHSWPPSGHQLTSTDLLARMGHMTDHSSWLSTFLSFLHHSSRTQRWVAQTLPDYGHSTNCLVWTPQWSPAWLLYLIDSVCLVIRVHGSHHCGMSPCIQNSVVGPFFVVTYLCSPSRVLLAPPPNPERCYSGNHC